MPLSIRCKACGKRAVLSGNAGERTVCAACGAELPRASAVAKDELEGAASFAPGRAVDGDVSESDAPTEPENFLVGRPPSLASRLLPLAAAVVILSGVLAAAIWFRHPAKQSPSETLTRAVEMETEARALLVDGKLQASRDKFDAIKRQLATAPADDAELHAMADRINEQEEAVDRQIRSAQALAAPAPSISVTPVRPNVPSVRPSERKVEVASIDPGADATTGEIRSPRESRVGKTATPAATTGPARAGPPRVIARAPIRPAPELPGELTDKEIGDSIQAGVNFLIQQFDPVRHELKYQIGEKTAYHGGMDALCVYALMQCGEAIPDPRLNIKGPFMSGLVDVMKSMPNDQGTVTYARGIRATALALFNRKEDRKALQADVKYLIDNSVAGGYAYAGKTPSPTGPRNGPNFLAGFGGQPDNSNSQYGLLGVWAGAEAEVEVPTGYWHAVEKHWTSCQMPNGQWEYSMARTGGGSLSMTCAGVASLFVTHDYLDAPHFAANVGRPPFSPALKKGLDWLEEGNHVTNTADSTWWGYTLYGVERVGLASGFKYFGRHDWYREIARELLKSQKPDGSWARTSSFLENGDLVDTAYCLLVLARGRHPILMNKLRFEGNWANRPRDLANLASYASLQLERPINWQIVPLTQEASGDPNNVNADWTNWLDSPVLYLASDQPVTISDADAEKIRAFVNAGGLLFTQADGDSAEFNKFAGELAHRLFPKYEMSDLPPGHPLYSVVFKINPKPTLKVVTNGARVLMLHTPTDLSKFWQGRERKQHKAAFDLGVNLFVYATGKRDLRNRLDSNYVSAAPDAGGSYHVRLARLKYAGNWDPEPYAWTRFSRAFQRQTGYALDVSIVDARDLKPDVAPVASLTGTTNYKPTADEIEAIRKYIQGGGMLLVDGAGGSGMFEEAMRSALATTFPTELPATLRATHPLLQTGLPGMEDLTHPRVRPYAVETLGKDVGLPLFITSGRGHVISSQIDMTCGLLGTGTWGIAGYDPAYAQSFVKNAILWTLDGQKDE